VPPSPGRSLFSVAGALGERALGVVAWPMAGMPNSPDGIIEVVPYSEAWPAMFDDAQAALAEALDDVVQSIEHIGSTAVEGLSAKPTIDILVVVSSMERFLERLPKVEALGFDYRADNTLVGSDNHLFLRRVVEGKRIHHVHVVRAGSPEIEEYRLFRDALRSDVALAKEYERMKVALSTEHADDRMRYVTEKAAWVDGVLRSLRGRAGR
jgi:GrpB-like predicted nucleotidyltransferase (UPF0157 family)